ncbi:MAG: hypothetical protein OEN50_17910 [Deltaproteobacteria bacterium]|nr:hypothetical protein [Deltaproteobacteria bacterium]
MRNLFWAFACGVVVCACADSYEHDPKLAATRAEDFARTTFVSRDADKGYAMLSDSGKRYVPLEIFKETVVKSHPRSYPARITATDYEGMSGEKAIYIYLKGDNGGENFYYTVTLDGTAASDYKVTRFSRGSGPFNSGSSRRPLTK